ncbi:uncharacterized protein LOC130689541 [Daphnia carinata]|uniref:uncharacterized protein LOC130689541 n=1 Tax=Daphnia carinata TaxID=120202 RepID=UPI00257B7EB1|nr:uncharacterized protein LOC130689541 [Daphnia carinata]
MDDRMPHCFCVTIVLILALPTCFAAASDWKAKFEQLEENYDKMKAHFETLERKVDQLEAKVKKQDSILAVLEKGHRPLKDSVDINQHRRHNATLRTCHEIHVANPSYTSGMYWIDPDGHGIGDPPIHVHCDMVHKTNNVTKGAEGFQSGMTSILHDSESKKDIGNCTEPGCYSRQIKHYASERQIAALIQLSSSCTQNISYHCRNTPLNYNGIAYAWWNGKDGQKHEFSDWLTSCEQLSGKKYAINGVIRGERLPITRVHFSNPFQGSGQYTVSRLRCSGKAKVEPMPTSCDDLWRMGHTLNGFYSVRGAKRMETVYCQFDKRPNEQGFQKWIGYVDVKSQPTYFYVQKNTTFNSTNVSIPFEVEKVNVGNAMDLKNGTFTAPRDGLYFFSFSCLTTAGTTAKPVFAAVGLFLNAVQVGEAWVHEGTTTVNRDSPLTFQSTLTLKAGDRIWLQIKSLGDTGFLYDDKNGYNHFNGFMLDEEITRSL